MRKAMIATVSVAARFSSATAAIMAMFFGLGDLPADPAGVPRTARPGNISAALSYRWQARVPARAHTMVESLGRICAQPRWQERPMTLDDGIVSLL
jgi:hypothetical protein